MGVGRTSRGTRAERVGRPREPHIETLRGLACVLLVSVHVVGDADEGLRLSEGHILNHLIWTFQPLRMPLFAFLSGLLFDPVAADGNRMRSKLLDKAHRLLVPLVTVGTVFFLTRSAIHDTPLTEIWRVYFTEYDQFWYLTATFIVMTTSVLAAWFSSNARIAVAACWVGGLGLYLLDLQIEPNWFSITKAFYLAPFFFLGQLFRATGFGKRVAPRSGIVAALIGAVVVLVTLRHMQLEVPVVRFGQQGLGMLLLSLALCAFLFALRWQHTWLAYVGPYSYAIFLFHLFFTAGSRDFVQRFDAHANPYMVFALGMLAGLVGPIVVQRALLTQPRLAWAFLGQRRTQAVERPEGAAPTQQGPAGAPVSAR